MLDINIAAIISAKIESEYSGFPLMGGTSCHPSSTILIKNH